tara:strand:+ start:6304 stop:7095 length:792 start_codon:yes stop_codon:yes gene_type:complete
MARTLKRPMFRRGGTVNDGIMTGLVDRKQLADGPMNPAMVGQSARDYIEQFEPLLREFTPKTKLPLGQLGLNLISGKFAGDGLLRNLAGSAQGPYAQFVKADDAREAAIRGGAAKLGLGQALKDATPEKLIAAQREAKIMLPANATPEEIRAKTAELLEKKYTGVTYGDTANFRRAYEDNKKDLGKGFRAYNLTVFEEIISPQLRKQNKIPKDRISIKDGKYDTKRKTPGVYVDIENGKVIEITNELEVLPLDQFDDLFRQQY